MAVSYSIYFLFGKTSRQFNLALSSYDKSLSNDSSVSRESPTFLLVDTLANEIKDALFMEGTAPEIRDALLVNVTHQTGHISLPFPEVKKGLGKIIAIATTHGFSVIDPQTEKVSLASRPQKALVRTQIFGCQCDKLSEPIISISEAENRASKYGGLSNELRRVAALPQSQKRLFQCAHCESFLQSGDYFLSGRPYYFKVPPTMEKDWKKSPWIDPIEALQFQRLANEFLARITATSTTGKATGRTCSESSCGRVALSSSNFCSQHQFAALIKSGSFMPPPKGRWFEPYIEKSFVVMFD